MEIFKLIGDITPPNRYNINIRDLPPVAYEIHTIKEKISCSIQIDNSIVTVKCEVSKYKQEMLGWYLNYATDFTRAILHLISFSLADALDVFFDKVVAPDGTELKLLRSDENLKKLCTAFTLGDSKFGLALQAVRKEPNLFLALTDMISVLRDGTADISACNRAIERLRNLLLPSETNRDKAWKNLQEKLGLTSDFAKYITEETTTYKHGHLKPLTPEVRSEILRRTWIIMNQFIAYKIGNSTSITE